VLLMLQWNPIYPGIAALFVAALASGLCRPDLWRNTLVDGLLDDLLGFGGEDSAGASFSSGWYRLDNGQGWHRPGFARGTDHCADGQRSWGDQPRAYGATI
jgi:hypothetical protein